MKKWKTNTLVKTTFTLAIVGLSQTTAHAEKWNKRNNPYNLQIVNRVLHKNPAPYLYDVSFLPLEGKTTTEAWADSYWPDYLGSIAARWSTPEYKTSIDSHYDLKKTLKLNIQPPTRDQVLRMSQNELAALSPAEKYDIYMGNYSYPTVSSIKKTTSEKDPDWEGICNGWSPAALNHAEPAPNTLTSKDGIQVPFGSSDVKALLGYYYAYYAKAAESRQLGARCFHDIKKANVWGTYDGCSDVNPGAFHIALTNEIGRNKQGIIVDIARDKEVWNQPVYAYKSKVLDVRSPSKNAADGTATEMVMETEMFYAEDDEENVSFQPLIANGKNKTKSRIYRYALEINRLNNIIGGEWLDGDKVDTNSKTTEEELDKITYGRPDFIWVKEKVTRFEAPLDGLNQIYRSSGE